jgi:hypothetical protein
VKQTSVTSTLQLGSSGSSSSTTVADVIAGLEQLQAFFNLSEAGCNETINFAYSGSTAFGVSQYGNILFHASTLNCMGQVHISFASPFLLNPLWLKCVAADCEIYF